MKTLAQVIKERPEYKTLINAVIRNIGMESVDDVMNHGADGGFPGFVYHSDTCKFFKCHKESIIKLLNELADDLGEDPLKLVASFNCLKDHKLSPYDIAQAIFSDEGEFIDVIHNALSWFALEEVCRMFEA